MGLDSKIIEGSRSGQRRFHPDDIQMVQRLLAAHPDWSRQKIALDLCRHWNWTSPDGAFNRCACQHWLKRLEKKGIITLPPPRSTRSSAVLSVSAPQPQPEWLADSFSLDDVVVRPVRKTEQPRWRALMRAHHYLGFWSMVGESIGYVATIRERWMALLGWASAAWKSCHREAWIGWNEELKLKRLHLIANNVRFLILPGVTVKHLASKVLALNLKRLSSDWENRYGHPIVLVETFVDPSRFAGTCYKAAGFFPLGQTKGFTKTRQGYVAHGKPRVIFIRPLHPKAREFLGAVFPSVPKVHTKEVAWRMDVNQLPLIGEGSLLEFLGTLTDPRKRRGIRHPMVSLLATAICAILSGMKSYVAIEQWAASLPQEALARLGFTHATPPSEITFRRLFQTINVEEFDRRVGLWFARRQPFQDQQIAVDGKTVRGSQDGPQKAIHLLSAFLAAQGVTIAQRNVDAKTNEIPELKSLLDPLPLEGTVVTADALHTQRETARYLVEDKKADYLLTVKDNQPGILTEIESLASRLRLSFSPSGDFAGEGTWTD